MKLLELQVRKMLLILRPLHKSQYDQAIEKNLMIFYVFYYINLIHLGVQQDGHTKGQLHGGGLSFPNYAKHNVTNLKEMFSKMYQSKSHALNF